MDEIRDEIKPKEEEKKCRRRNKTKAICRKTGDHAHYPPPTRRTKPTRPRHAPSPILESICQLTPKSRYGECRKNQAADIGTTAYDGCGEFVSSTTTTGEDSWNCVACGCHRSFHREESLSEDGVPKKILEVLKISSSRFREIFFSPYGDRKTKHVATDRSYGGDLSEEEERRVKRLRKKYTTEQTEKMRSYAEKLRWKLSSESREEVEVFCVETGVSRENFRVWMNNHNEAHGEDLSEEEEEEGRVKRFKTKFTAEQTEKMRVYAEKLRWKMSPESREEVEAFCIEIGVNRKKFRIWMNNHKERQ